jgi:hypothetical protein
MNSSSLREKAVLCLRIARQLSWNNPSRLQLADLADRFSNAKQKKSKHKMIRHEDSMLASAVRSTKS